MVLYDGGIDRNAHTANVTWCARQELDDKFSRVLPNNKISLSWWRHQREKCRWKMEGSGEMDHGHRSGVARSSSSNLKDLGAPTHGTRISCTELYAPTNYSMQSQKTPNDQHDHSCPCVP